nr:galactose ABC transporter substrate-binding protein [Raoultella sp. NCTC 9187]
MTTTLCRWCVRPLRKTGKTAPDVQLLMNDSQNDQSKQNDQIDVLLAKGVKALAINLVDPAAAGTVIDKARGQNVPVVFFNKEPSRKALDSYDKAFYVGTDSKESGIIQGDLIAKHWKANARLGSEQRRSDSVCAAERRAGPSGC